MTIALFKASFLQISRLIILPVVVSSLTTGCVVIPGMHVSESTHADEYDVHAITPELVAQTLQENRSRQQQPTGIDSVEMSEAARDYDIGPGDVLSVIVWDHPELSTPDNSAVTSLLSQPTSGTSSPAIASVPSAGSPVGHLVASDGTMFFPYVGTFSVAGLNVAKVRDYLTKHLAKTVKDPQVTVSVSGFRSQRVVVTGEVRSPGITALTDTPKGLLDAINEHGGLGDRASRRSIYLTRQGQRYELSLTSLLKGGRGASNPVLMPGDVIQVPDITNDQVFVLGEVNKVSPLPMARGEMTLTEAIASVGGMDKLSANDSGVLVFRAPTTTVDGGEEKSIKPSVFTLDMSQPVAILLAGDFMLQPRDVVYVKATGFSQYNSLIAQILPTISAIFFLDRLGK